MAITISGSGITSANIADGTIVNADVNASAAIDASKLTGVGPTKSTSNPAVDTNGALGDQWINTTSGEQFVCTDATTGANTWTNIGAGADVQPYTFDPTDPFEYGDGSDGDVTSISSTYTYLTNSPSSGTNTCTVSSSSGFTSGDQVLILQTQKNAGGFATSFYEMILISGVSGTTITFNTNLQNTYYGSSSGPTTAQMVLVPNYNNVTLSSQYDVPAWNGNEGGIIAFKVKGTLALSAKINAQGKGFRGGISNSSGYGAHTRMGEGQQSDNDYGAGPNGCGGGAGRMNQPSVLSAKSGAGGGHASSGANGEANANAGSAWGGQDLTSHLGFGGAGGAGGYDYGTPGGNGANGGGIIFICAATLTASGSGELNARGVDGIEGVGAGDGGGGAGGSIYIKSDSYTTNNACNASGGAASPDGGAGSDGRIHIQGTSAGTTSPTAYTG